MQDTRRTIGALVLALAGAAQAYAGNVQAGAAAAAVRLVQASSVDGIRDASACTVERRERVEWRHRGHPSKGMPVAKRVRETRQVCAGVARTEWRPDNDSAGANG